MKAYKTYYLMRVGATTLFGVLLGVLFLLGEPYAVEVFDILLIAMGLMTVVMNAPAFIFSLFHIKRRGEWISLLISAVAIAFGVLLALIRRDVILLVLGIFSVVLPVVRVLLVTERKKRLKREIPMILFGLFMVFVSVTQLEELVFFICSMAAFGFADVYLIWGLITLRFRLAAIAEWEAEKEASKRELTHTEEP